MLKFNDTGLRKNGITREQVLQALGDTFVIDIPELVDSKRNNPRSMWVGKTYAEQLLEIGIEYLDENEWYIYHADNAQAKYKNAYNNRGKKR